MEMTAKALGLIPSELSPSCYPVSIPAVRAELRDSAQPNADVFASGRTWHAQQPSK